MWVAKFRNWHKTCLIRPLCVKYQVTDYVYLLNHWGEKGNFYYTELHILEGEKEDVKGFIKEFKKDKSLKKIEINGNQIITLNVLTKKSHSPYSPVFDKKIIYTKPVIQHIDGFETWEIASWDKEILIKIMDIPDFKMELLSIKKIKGVDLFLPQIRPNISEKQMHAMKIAIKEGYYNFPRKTDLNKLAVESKVSKQTFQENLRKAENKLVPFLVEEF
ncbi:helix-turn-helix domain-containing protein [Candidatus Pacearchaeota archaeon]|nr:helix-turn-helix domain-containing protein [Candidatus Pacearchaeota archaeon]